MCLVSIQIVVDIFVTLPIARVWEKPLNAFYCFFFPSITTMVQHIVDKFMIPFITMLWCSVWLWEFCMRVWKIFCSFWLPAATLLHSALHFGFPLALSLPLSLSVYHFYPVLDSLPFPLLVPALHSLSSYLSWIGFEKLFWMDITISLDFLLFLHCYLFSFFSEEGRPTLVDWYSEPR